MSDTKLHAIVSNPVFLQKYGKKSLTNDYTPPRLVMSDRSLVSPFIDLFPVTEKPSPQQ